MNTKTSINSTPDFLTLLPRKYHPLVGSILIFAGIAIKMLAPVSHNYWLNVAASLPLCFGFGFMLFSASLTVTCSLECTLKKAAWGTSIGTSIALAIMATLQAIALTH
jgi:hypothetical protein